MINLWEQAIKDGDRERAADIRADIRKEMVKIMRDMEKEAAEGEDSISSDSP